MSKKKNKYNAKKGIAADGTVCASQKEARRYNELLFLQRAGTIRDLRTQVPYELVPAIREPDRKGPRGGLIKGRVIEKSVKYIADFVYIVCSTGEQIVEDSKGKRTPDYIIKRKLMLWIHGIRVKET